MVCGDPLLVSTTNDFNAVTFSRSAGYISDGFYFSSDEALGSFNVHLRGKMGYVDETTGEIVRFRRAKSPALDAGGRGAGLEPEPNGLRRNLGYWGGTPWATMTPWKGLQIYLK